MKRRRITATRYKLRRMKRIRNARRRRQLKELRDYFVVIFWFVAVMLILGLVGHIDYLDGIN